MICKHCGTENSDSAKFCHECGKPLEAEQAASSGRKKWILIGAIAAAVILIVCLVAAQKPAGDGSGTEKNSTIAREDSGSDPAGGDEAKEKQSASAQAEPDEEALRDFLYNFIIYGEKDTGLTSFSCDETDAMTMMDGVMWNISCVDYSAYPGEEEPAELSMEGSTDPRGMMLDENGDPIKMCYVYDAEKIDWIMENIFNYPKSGIEDATARAEEILENTDPFDRMRMFYLEDGKYYYITGGIGWETDYEVTIDDLEQDGEYYDVDYTVDAAFMPGTDAEETESWECSAKMQYKEIDGQYYWSLYEYERK